MDVFFRQKVEEHLIRVGIYRKKLVEEQQYIEERRRAFENFMKFQIKLRRKRSKKIIQNNIFKDVIEGKEPSFSKFEKYLTLPPVQIIDSKLENILIEKAFDDNEEVFFDKLFENLKKELKSTEQKMLPISSRTSSQRLYEMLSFTNEEWNDYMRRKKQKKIKDIILKFQQRFKK